MDDDRNYYTVEEVADMLDKHKKTIYKWIKDGDLELVMPGRPLKIRKSIVDEMLK